jgi:K+-sensing histidine kinase KdpD
MKNKFNTLRKYIFEGSEKEYTKETINGLFRSILEPVISNQKIEACILLKINEIEDKKSLLQRLSFSQNKIYSYNNNFLNFNWGDNSLTDLWQTTEFLIVLGQRYSAALIWDYQNNRNSSEICVLYNSKIVGDIAKNIADNSKENISDYIIKYAPDRRENSILNKSIENIVSILDDKNVEYIFSEKEKNNILNSDDTVKTAEIIAEKAKFIAHEIKNNLSIINLYSTIANKRLQNLQIDDENFNSMKNSLKNVMNASENVSNLISDLRCLSTPYLVEFSLKDFILNIVELCKEKADKQKVNLEVDKFEDIIVKTDKTKLQCTLTNIIFNAIEACEKSNIIKIEVLKTKTEIKILVKNNGKEIPKDIQNKIFEKEFTTKEKGNGLGLAICKTQMQLINGDVKLLSSTKNETVFEIIVK